MVISMRIVASIALIAAFLLPISGCGGCGFSCNDADDGVPSLVSVGFSDSMPEDVKQVVF